MIDSALEGDLHNIIQIRGKQINIYRNHPAVITRERKREREQGTDFSLRLCVMVNVLTLLPFYIKRSELVVFSQQTTHSIFRYKYLGRKREM